MTTKAYHSGNIHFTIMKQTIIILMAVALLSACGTSKSVQGTGKENIAISNEKGKTNSTIEYLRKVSDNAVYSKNIVSAIDFTINAMGKEFNVSGKLQMRRDEVIRITLTPFGIMEAGRLEFTPDYVMIVDRINKQYIKASYKDVSFLQSNGMDFYTLQSLFWNELFTPGKKSLSDSDLSNFKVNMSTVAKRPIELQYGDLSFLWDTDIEQKNILNANITYRKGTAQQSTMTFDYSKFTNMGSKRFPAKEVLTFNSNATGLGKMVLDIEMNKISNDNNWETTTTLSDRYKKVTVQEVLGKLLGK